MPDKLAGQHAPGGTYTWVSQAVHTVEDQVVHSSWYQQPHHSTLWPLISTSWAFSLARTGSCCVSTQLS